MSQYDASEFQILRHEPNTSMDIIKINFLKNKNTSYLFSFHLNLNI